jgi:hypothetical protein
MFCIHVPMSEMPAKEQLEIAMSKSAKHGGATQGWKGLCQGGHFQFSGFHSFHAGTSAWNFSPFLNHIFGTLSVLGYSLRHRKNSPLVT